jgi:tRNA pseudouridine55 synthase
VLVVLLGQATKIAGHLTEGEKTYSGQLRLGQSTDTYDSQGTVQEEKPWQRLSPDAVRQAMLDWRQDRTQEVPPVSAAKHQGRPLYALARAGKETPVKVKDIEIFSVEVLWVDLPLAAFRVRVSPGVYIRSLVHSLGMRLGCGAHLSALTREASRPYGLDQAHGLDEVLADPAGLAQKVIPLADALPHWPKARLHARDTALVRNGARVPHAATGLAADATRALFLAPDGAPLALAERDGGGGDTPWAVLRGLWQTDEPMNAGL